MAGCRQITASVLLIMASLFSFTAVGYFAEEFLEYTDDEFARADPTFDVSFGLQVDISSSVFKRDVTITSRADSLHAALLECMAGSFVLYGDIAHIKASRVPVCAFHNLRILSFLAHSPCHCAICVAKAPHDCKGQSGHVLLRGNTISMGMCALLGPSSRE